MLEIMSEIALLLEKSREYERRLKLIDAAYQQLVDEGHLRQFECNAAKKELRTLSAADVAVLIDHVTSNY